MIIVIYAKASSK